MESATAVDLSQSVACNGLIVENICKNLDAKNLIHMRSVTTLWRAVATTTLTKYHMLVVYIHDRRKFHELEKLITTGSFPNVLHAWDLRVLINMKPDDDTREELDNGNYVGPQNYPAYLQEKVNHLSSKIAKFSRGLRISLERSPSFYDQDGPAERSALLSILFREYCHIEELDLTELLFSKKDILPDVFRLGAIKLPNLKRIILPHINNPAQYSFYKHIILAAPNIEKFGMDSFKATLSVLKVIMECGKTDCVKKLVIFLTLLESTSNGELEVLKNFTDCRPKLLNVNIVEGDMHYDLVREILSIRRVLRGFFIATSSTLESMTVPELSFLDYHEDGDARNSSSVVPVFGKLRILNLANARCWPCSKSTEVCILPRTVLPAACFPNLTEVGMYFGPGSVEQNLKFHAVNTTVRQDSRFYQFTTVKKLTVNCSYGAKDLEILAARFPNMKELTFVQEVGNLVRLPNEFRNLPHCLESLTLKYVVLNYSDSLEKSLSKLLTNLGKNEIDSLAIDQSSRGLNSVPQQNTMRNTRSSLKGIKNRRIIFDADVYLRGRKMALEPPDTTRWERYRAECMRDCP